MPTDFVFATDQPNLSFTGLKSVTAATAYDAAVPTLTAPAALVAQVRPAPPAPPPRHARIVGTVFDSAATQWLSGATVQLVDAANPSIAAKSCGFHRPLNFVSAAISRGSTR